MKGLEKDGPDKKLSHQGWSAIIQGFHSCSRHTTRSNKFTCGLGPPIILRFSSNMTCGIVPSRSIIWTYGWEFCWKSAGKQFLETFCTGTSGYMHDKHLSPHLVPECRRGLLTNGSAQRQRSPNSTAAGADIAQTGRCPAWRSGSSIPQRENHTGGIIFNTQDLSNCVVTLVAFTWVHADILGLDVDIDQTLTLDGCSSWMGMTYVLMHVTQQSWPGTPCMMACLFIAFSLNVQQQLQVMLHVRNLSCCLFNN